MGDVFFSFTANVTLAAVPPCAGFAGRLLGGMESKPGLFHFIFTNSFIALT